MHRKMRVQATSMAWSASSGMFKNNAGDDTNLLSFDCLRGWGGGGAVPEHDDNGLFPQ